MGFFTECGFFGTLYNYGTFQLTTSPRSALSTHETAVRDTAFVDSTRIAPLEPASGVATPAGTATPA
jgi:hypothetical protein